jgi:uncharacterized membrane protein HdeD (DUF308 family)
MTMSEPWFDENQFGALFGAIGGGGFGTLCGLWGAAAGTLAPRGKGRMFVFGFGWLMIVLGALSLVFGLVALAAGQPWGIWYGPVLMGILMAALIGSMMPMLRMRYRQAEERKMQAEDFRRG